MTHNILTSMAALLTAAVLSACAHAPNNPALATSGQKEALANLEQDYSEGNYAKVARTVGLSVELQTAPASVQIPALKLQAFSYCLQGNTAQCKRSFEKLLQRYPDFDLAETERNHPMWGPVFTEVKNHAGGQTT